MRYLQVYENFFSPDDVEIRWGREERRADNTVKNVIVSYRGKDITGQKLKIVRVRKVIRFFSDLLSKSIKRFNPSFSFVG